MSTNAHSGVRQHWWIIYHALVAPRKAEEIALHTGVSATTVHRVIATYNRLGLETPGKGGRRHQYLTLQEEQALLTPFFRQAKSGEIATVAQIQQAFEERIGHEVDDSTIYRLLKRHGWRKLMPRPRQPKADPQIQEQFKKIFPAQVEAAVATREAGMSAPSWSWHKMKAADASHQPGKALLGASRSTPTRPCPGCARVHLCVYCCGTYTR